MLTNKVFLRKTKRGNILKVRMGSNCRSWLFP